MVITMNTFYADERLEGSRKGLLSYLITKEPKNCI